MKKYAFLLVAFLMATAQMAFAACSKSIPNQTAKNGGGCVVALTYHSPVITCNYDKSGMAIVTMVRVYESSISKEGPWTEMWNAIDKSKSHGTINVQLSRNAKYVQFEFDGTASMTWSNITETQGSYLELNTTSLDFGAVRWGESKTLNFNVDYSAVGAGVNSSSYHYVPNVGYIGGGCDYGTQAVQVTYTPGSLSNEGAVITIADKRINLSGHGYLDAPTGVQVTGQTFTTASLQWDAVAGASSYVITEKTTGAKTSTSSTNITLEGLINNTTYSYTVAGVCDGGTGTESAAVEVKTKNAHPTAQEAANVTTNSFVASWTAVEGLNDYTLVVKKKATAAEVLNQAVQGTTYTVEGLEPGTTYTYHILANVENITAASNIVTLTTGLDVPANLATAQVQGSQFTANWDAATGATDYEILLTSAGQTVANEVVSATSYTAQNLQPNTTYNLQVRARAAVVTRGVEDVVTSDYSAPVEVLTNAVVTVNALGELAATTTYQWVILSGTQAEDGSFTLGTELKLNVSNTDASGAAYLAYLEVNGAKTTKTTANLTVSGTDVVNIAYAKLAPATALQASEILKDGFTLGFTTSANAEAYTVEVCNVQNEVLQTLTVAQPAEGTSAEVAVTGLDANTTYTCRVQATRAEGAVQAAFTDYVSVVTNSVMTVHYVGDYTEGMSHTFELVAGVEGTDGSFELDSKVKVNSTHTDETGTIFFDYIELQGTTYNEQPVEFLVTGSTDVYIAYTCLTAATELQTVSTQKDAISLQWTAATGADDYVVEVCDKDKKVLQTLVTAGTQLDVQELTPATAYFFRVQSRAQEGRFTAYTDYIQATTNTVLTVEHVGEYAEGIQEEINLIEGNKALDGSYSLGSIVEISSTHTNASGNLFFDYMLMNKAKVTEQPAQLTLVGNDTVQIAYTYLAPVSELQASECMKDGFKLSWPVAEGAEQYVVELCDAEHKVLQTVTVDATVDEAGLPVAGFVKYSNLESSTTYTCRVQSLSQEGRIVQAFSEYLTVQTYAQVTINKVGEYAEGISYLVELLAGDQAVDGSFKVGSEIEILSMHSQEAEGVVFDYVEINGNKFYEEGMPFIITENMTVNLAYTYLATVTECSVLDLGHNSFVLSWPVAKGADDYQIQLCDATQQFIREWVVPAPVVEEGQEPALTVRAEVTELVPNTTYTVRVQSRADAGRIVTPYTDYQTATTYCYLSVNAVGAEAESIAYDLTLVSGKEAEEGAYSLGSVLQLSVRNTTENLAVYFDSITINEEVYRVPDVEFTVAGNDVIHIVYSALPTVTPKVKGMQKDKFTLHWEAVKTADAYIVEVMDLENVLVAKDTVILTNDQITGLEPNTEYQARVIPTRNNLAVQAIPTEYTLVRTNTVLTLVPKTNGYGSVEFNTTLISGSQGADGSYTLGSVVEVEGYPASYSYMHQYFDYTEANGKKYDTPKITWTMVGMDTITSCFYYLEPITKVTGTKISKNQIELTWEAAPGAEQYYIQLQDPDGMPLEDYWAHEPKAVFKNLDPNTDYMWSSRSFAQGSRYRTEMTDPISFTTYAEIKVESVGECAEGTSYELEVVKGKLDAEESAPKGSVLKIKANHTGLAAEEVELDYIQINEEKFTTDSVEFVVEGNTNIQIAYKETVHTAIDEATPDASVNAPVAYTQGRVIYMDRMVEQTPFAVFYGSACIAYGKATDEAVAVPVFQQGVYIVRMGETAVKLVVY